MMNLRIRRLRADSEQISSVFKDHPRIRLVDSHGNPPEKYTFEFQVKGLVPEEDNSFRIADIHRAEVFLPLDYPRRPPFCRMITPVFHPNIDPQKICIGDHWSAAQSLGHLVVRIGEMLCYQSYNVKSPLNAEAAAWAQENSAQLPLEQDDLSRNL
jgi:ubiquitin-protein ligase